MPFFSYSDHSGGNVSAHAAILVGSALSDPYLCYSAGLNGVTGSSYGEYQIKALNWLLEIQVDKLKYCLHIYSIYRKTLERDQTQKKSKNTFFK